MCRSNKLTVRVRPSALLVPALFLLLTDTPALLAALLLAALLHELAHYAMLRLFGIRAACFTLTGLGASLYVPELHRLSYGAELLSAAAGPLMNLLLWVLLSLTARDELSLFAGAQMVLGVLNLLPVRPMDGGRILWCILALLTSEERAERLLRVLSSALAVGLVLGALLLLWQGRGNLTLLITAVWLLVPPAAKPCRGTRMG